MPSQRAWSAKAGDHVVAFSAIADNDAFFACVHERQLKVTHAIGFADHHAYIPNDIARLNRLADQSQASFLITTEKDAVKLDVADFTKSVVALRISAHLKPEDAVLRLLRRSMSDRW